MKSIQGLESMPGLGFLHTQSSRCGMLSYYSGIFKVLIILTLIIQPYYTHSRQPMSKFTLNFENIARGIVHRNQKQPAKTNSIKPGFEWLKNYLGPWQSSSNKQPDKQKPNMLRKNTTRRLLKSRQRSTTINNENVNMLNSPSYGIMSKKAVVKRIEDSDIMGLKEPTKERRYSCELFRQPRKQAKMSKNRTYLFRPRSYQAIQQSSLPSILQPWETEHMEPLEADILHYKYR